MDRVMIVDDDPATRKLMGLWVERMGCEVTEAANANDALDAVSNEPPAVALCDIELPGRNGLWLARELHRVYPETAVIMTTAVQDFDAAVASLRSGALDYLVKPLDDVRLSDAVHKGIERHRTHVTEGKLRADLKARTDQVSIALADFEVNAIAAVDAMLTMLATRERDAHDNGSRVAKLAVDLALALGVSEPALSAIERAALLHDVGKLAVPEALLRKPSALSSDERRLVRSYPERGHAFLRQVPFLAAAAQIVLRSRERFDGTGYPSGLKGDEIPLGARILAVADAYEAMTRPRPYRAPLAPPAAKAELTRQRGQQFDPAVVDAFLMLRA